MLVVDVNALGTVYALYLFDQVVLNCQLAADCQNLSRLHSTLGNQLTFLDILSFLDDNLIVERNNLGKHLAVCAGDVDGVGALVVETEVCDTGQVADDGRVLRFSCLEQLLNPRKTLGNIAGGSDAAGMEGTHGQLGTRLTDRLRRDDADRLADADRLTVGQVCAVALGADTLLGLAVEDGADLDLGDASVHNLLRGLLVDHLFSGCQHLAGLWIDKVICQIASGQTLGQALDDAAAVCNVINHDALVGAAVVAADDNILRNVYQTAGQVTGVRCTQRGIGQTFTRASGGLEVLQDVQAFTVVGFNRDFDRLTGGVGDQSAHAGQLTDLLHRASRTGIGKHVNRVALTEGGVQLFLDRLGGVVPDLDNTVVTNVIRNQAAVVLALDLRNLLIGLRDQLLLVLWDQRVAYRDGQAALGGIFKALVFDAVQNLGGAHGAAVADAAVDDLAELFLSNQEGNLQVKLLFRISSVHKAQILRDRVVEDDLSDGGVDQAADGLALHLAGDADLDRRMQADHTGVVCHLGLVEVAEHLAGARLVVADHGQIVGTEDHVLGRDGDRTSVGWFQQVARCQHQEARFSLCLGGKRQMDRHLVAVEVGVECGTYQRVQTDGAALYQDRLKRLDAQTVQGRRTV